MSYVTSDMSPCSWPSPSHNLLGHIGLLLLLMVRVPTPGCHVSPRLRAVRCLVQLVARVCVTLESTLFRALTASLVPGFPQNGLGPSRSDFHSHF